MMFEFEGFVPEFKKYCGILVRQGRYHDVSMFPKEMVAEALRTHCSIYRSRVMIFFQNAIILRCDAQKIEATSDHDTSLFSAHLLASGNEMVWFWFQQQRSRNGWSRSLVEDSRVGDLGLMQFFSHSDWRVEDDPL